MNSYLNYEIVNFCEIHDDTWSSQIDEVPMFGTKPTHDAWTILFSFNSVRKVELGNLQEEEDKIQKKQTI